MARVEIQKYHLTCSFSINTLSDEEVRALQEFKAYLNKINSKFRDWDSECIKTGWHAYEESENSNFLEFKVPTVSTSEDCRKYLIGE